jgi:hypothetical protein
LELMNPSKGTWREILCSYHTPGDPANKRGTWTGEYALYFTFLWVRPTPNALN